MVNSSPHQKLHPKGINILAPHTYVAKPVSPEMVDFLLNPPRAVGSDADKSFDTARAAN